MSCDVDGMCVVRVFFFCVMFNYCCFLLLLAFCRFCLGDGLAQLVVCEDGKTCMDISSLGTGMPKELTPLSWSITGADIVCMMASGVGEKTLAGCWPVGHGQGLSCECKRGWFGVFRLVAF